jgi:ribosomal protein S18 acetylase RimI-like enzyme
MTKNNILLLFKAYFSQAVQITRSEISDLDIIFQLFADAIQYQEQRGFELWPLFDRKMIEKEIIEGRHWKISIGSEIACVFSVLYSDSLIWKELDKNDAVYLHRIATSKDHKGKNLIVSVRDWAIEHARQSGKRFVRMDTWGNNVNMRDYYIRHGFTFLKQHHLDQEKGEIPHYGGPVLSLLQIEV